MLFKGLPAILETGVDPIRALSETSEDKPREDEGGCTFVAKSLWLTVLDGFVDCDDCVSAAAGVRLHQASEASWRGC